MTEKQELILKAALELFATHGYTAVSTSSIAKQAGVSEGLIFRHFGNKQGLLDALMAQAFEKLAVLYAPILMEQDPKQALRRAINLPFHVEESEYHFWKLQFKLKWELEISGRDKAQPLIDKLEWAFMVLEYDVPQKEAEVLYHIIESIASGILKEGLDTQIHLQDFLLDKYQV